MPPFARAAVTGGLSRPCLAGPVAEEPESTLNKGAETF